MKIVDRYIILTYIKNYLLSFAVLVGLYIVLDMVFNFDELVDVKGTRGAGGSSSLLILFTIADFYMYQSLLIFVHLSAVIPIVAAAFTLIRLARFNELTAMLAAGVPLLRVAMPIILVSMVLNVLVLADQEWLIPNSIPKLVREHADLYQGSTKSFPIRAMEVEGGARLCAGLYTPGSEQRAPRMQVMDLIEFTPDLQPLSHVLADAAEWDSKREVWVLTNGLRRGIAAGGPNVPEQPIAVFKGTTTPEEIALYHSRSFIQLLSTQRINQLLQRRTFGTADLLRVKHTRFTQPLCNILILLLAISAVLQRDSTSLKAASFKCVALAGTGMGVVFLFYHLAGSPPQDPFWMESWPALMAWMPVFVLGPLSVWMLDRVET